MRETAERERTALHEAGHAVIAAACGWIVGPVSINSTVPGRGCAMSVPPPVSAAADTDFDQPFVRWPAAAREHFESQAVVYLAGDLAELLFAPRTGRGGERMPVAAAEMAADRAGAGGRAPGGLPAATQAEHAAVTAVMGASPDDAEEVARVAAWAHWGDPAAAGAWVAYMDTQARALLLERERRVRRLADVLLASGTLGGEAVRRLLG